MIYVYEPDLSGREREYLLDAFDSSWISSRGPYLDRFESLFSQVSQAGRAAAVSNGTVALHLALHCLGIGPGDEVIVPSFTYIASVNTIVQTGATPVFADSKADDWLIDPDHVEKLITPRTRAIMPVHLYGAICDMDRLCAIAQQHKLEIIEDCAEALGATYKGRQAGTFGKVATFSFFGNKLVTTGEGGMVTTKDEELFERMVIAKGQGQDPSRRYWHSVLGFNYRMTNLAAAIGLAQLERVEQILERKREIGKMYRTLLSSRNDLSFQVLPNYVESSEWLVSVLLPKDSHRELVMSRMAEAGIETRPTFYCAHSMPPHYRAELNLPIAQAIAERGISLPSHPKLTDTQIEQVCATLIREINHP